MKAKYLILETLTGREISFLFSYSEIHAEVAHRLETQSAMCPLKVVSAGEVFVDSDHIAVSHGSTTLDIKRNEERESIDLRILENHFRD